MVNTNMNETVSDGSALTLEKLQEMVELIPKYVPPKEKFFTTFFPHIKDIDGWEVVFPYSDDTRVLKYVEENDWVTMSNYAPQIIALDLKAMKESWYE